MLWALPIAGWVILDLGWQANLWWQLAQTARQFAGKTIDENYRASADHELYALVWPDGRRKDVDEALFENPGPMVLRVR